MNFEHKCLPVVWYRYVKDGLRRWCWYTEWYPGCYPSSRRWGRTGSPPLQPFNRSGDPLSHFLVELAWCLVLHTTFLCFAILTKHFVGFSFSCIAIYRVLFSSVSVQLYSHRRSSVIVTEVFPWIISVGTVLCACYWSTWTAKEAALEQDKLKNHHDKALAEANDQKLLLQYKIANCEQIIESLEEKMDDYECQVTPYAFAILWLLLVNL